MVSGRTVTVRPPAKINWTLRVKGRRDDGFHEIESLVCPVSLHDSLTFTRRTDPGVELACDYSGIPTDQSNLIVKAARLLAEEAGASPGARADLTKRIPIGAGLGGGSSDAAFTLLALNRLWELDIPICRLMSLGAELGSDVCLFLTGGAVVMTGRGEHVRPVTVPWQGWIALVLPGTCVSTADVYRAWQAERDSVSPDVDLGQLLARRAETLGAAEWMSSTFNMLEAPLHRLHPELGVLQQQVAALAGRPVRVSGSGSTLFTAFDRRDEAEQFAGGVRGRWGIEVEVVRPIGPSEHRDLLENVIGSACSTEADMHRSDRPARINRVT